jgi:DNA-binding NarL/FixJ family response regulator
MRIVLAIEEELLRDALAALLASLGAYHVAGRCGDGAEALQMIQQLRPDAAVLDQYLPTLHTMELLAKLQPLDLGAKLIVLAARKDRKAVLEALRCGASGLVLRSGPARHLQEAIDQTRTGGVYISPLLSLDKIFVPTNAAQPDPLASLSTREYQVFSMLVDGCRAKEIAARLDLSPKTVDTYRSSLMKKLDIHDVAGLVKFAVRRNLTTTA